MMQQLARSTARTAARASAIAPRAAAPRVPLRCAAAAAPAPGPRAAPRAGAAAAAAPARPRAAAAVAGRRRSVRVAAGWGDPVEFKPATVLSSSKAATQLHKVLIDVGPEIAAGYTKGGQYLQIKVGDSKPGFFAIASPPDPNNQGVLEFLIKAAGDTAEKLVALPPGAAVDVSPVQGKGFPIEKLDGADSVLIFATGSGISPVRAVIESGALEGKSTRLFWGTRSPEATAYAERIPEWRSLGVDVVQVFSEGDGGRYVQDAFASDKRLGADPSKVSVLLCGQKPMSEAVRALMAEAGVAEGAILTNF
ncbi:hypothetical protein Rsub_06968 [Raphidocelis subcapitata]|uniref:FAD-binding FR-type domain-containing protein n=1 Tax=Raphidocelis subcapitata TaxID=307507 RepID=A0A2V0P3A8_9CHLO|nr:hypothetical protein Rsub_06968 [Raphidocelis subcapitata]|eukprot:GBF94346.1 hypothetical protein Rsub_06968 [Raphidocelis subcapitata]